MIPEKYNDVIIELLGIEHKSIAIKLRLINESYPVISDELLFKAIGCIDYYSRIQEDTAKQIVITLSSILYTYKQEHWTGLNQFLVIVLSRIGFAPSAIMADDHFDFEKNQFSPMDSIISQIYTTINQLKNEIIIDEKTYLLTDFQKKIWDKCSEVRFVGISAPTSAGKSFVILLKAIQNILTEGGNIVYIVPTLSLITQVVDDFHTKLKEFGLSHYDILTSYDKGGENKIYILTPERAISAYNETEKPFGEVNTFVVDEIQNIERIENENDERAKILFDSLIELSLNHNPKLIIFSGPRVSGLKKMGFEIFEEDNSIEIQANSSPVASFTYAIGEKGRKYLFKQYSQIVDNYLSIEIQNTDYIKLKGKQYRNKDYEYINNIIHLLGEDTKNVIFAPRPDTARNIAVELSKLSLKPKSNLDQLNSLVKYIEDTVHKNYQLIETLKNNIAYHHGQVPLHIRNVLEYAIKNKYIDNIVCTTTLMQGVNLPVQNIIMRNHYLATKRNKGIMPKLTNYEISNLRGRAGRLLKDFIGRTFVLDETAFDNEQETLFQDETKSLKAGYGEIFDKNKDKVNQYLFENIHPEKIDEEYKNNIHFLLTYIRNTILKHKQNSVKRLNAVGINYSKEEIDIIYNDLVKNLEIPLEKCYKNRYIDPLTLNDIYEQIDTFDLPMYISENELAERLYNLVCKIKEKFPTLYKKHLGDRELRQNDFYTVDNWMKEKTLKEILNHSYFDEPNNIDKTIKMLNTDICFNLTSLLRPFYFIKNEESNFISFIELGAYNPITLQLIKLNIPREVAIRLRNTIFKGFKEDALTNKIISEEIKANKDNIIFWDKIQLYHLL